jgi:hypothetical protein
MKDTSGNWISPPPTYDPIVAEGKYNFFLLADEMKHILIIGFCPSFSQMGQHTTSMSIGKCICQMRAA